MTDDALLLECLDEGREERAVEAFEALFRRYYPLLCAYGHRFVSLPEAEEIAQDCLLWVWEHRHALHMDTALGSYLLKMVYHKSLNLLKQSETRGRADTVFYEEHLLDTLQEPDFYRLEELSLRIESAVNALPGPFREAFVMHRYRGMSYNEIAVALEVSPKTVDYRIRQALRILRNELKDYLPLLAGWLWM